MALQRINREANTMRENSMTEICIEQIEGNNFKWLGTIAGPKDSCYEGGVFLLDITFPATYPFKAPKIKFITKVYHPNIGSETGGICLDILDSYWSPALTIDKILLSVRALLTDPNPYDVMEPAIAKLYLTVCFFFIYIFLYFSFIECYNTSHLKDRNQYDENVRNWTAKYA